MEAEMEQSQSLPSSHLDCDYDDDGEDNIHMMQGPMTPADTFKWVAVGMAAIARSPLVFQDSNLEKTLKKHMRDGIMLVTEYSGMGCAEECLHQIYQQVDSAGDYTICREGDLDSTCRRVLLARGEVAGHEAECLFGDVLSRYTPQELNRVHSLQKQEKRRHEKLMAKGDDTNGAGAKGCGPRFFQQAHTYLECQMDSTAYIA